MGVMQTTKDPSSQASGQDPLGHALEESVPASERHSFGQYFTPSALVALVLELVEAPAGAQARVLEPACGSGRFLLAARERWALTADQLHGFETDPLALAAAREQLKDVSILEQDFLDAEPAADFCRVIGNPPYVRDRGRGRDLYADFIDRSIAQLREGGRLALVLSNSWLDVDYGRAVRANLMDTCALEWIVESTAERWFREARVNTMILVARRCSDTSERAKQQVRFAQVREPLPASPQVLRKVPQNGLTARESWGPYLRAPEKFFSVRSGQSAVPLVALGEQAKLNRGFTTNDNGFFYPPTEAGIEERYLRPLLKSPKRVAGLRGTASSLPEQVFFCEKSRAELLELGDLGALAWIDAHRPSLSKSSWALPPQEASRLFLVKGTSDRFRQPLFDVPVFADQQLYSVRCAGGQTNEQALAALLNSSWCKLSIEMAGRVNFGDGVLWLALRDAREKILLPDLRLLDEAQIAGLVAALAAFPEQAVPSLCAIPDETSSAWWRAQERLDEQVGVLLGLSSDEQVELRLDLLERCRIRLKMAS